MGLHPTYEHIEALQEYFGVDLLRAVPLVLQHQVAVLARRPAAPAFTELRVGEVFTHYFIVC